MQALVYDEYCDLSGMRITEVAKPKPRQNDVVVEVHAAGINPIDWKVREGQMRGRFELDFPNVAGRDLSGIVIEVGQDVTSLKRGDHFFGLARPIGGAAMPNLSRLTLVCSGSSHQIFPMLRPLPFPLSVLLR